MKYSVIIPAFNEQEHIRRSIDALKRQNIGRDEYEIIVVDNNSTDRTSEIAVAAGADKVVLETTQGTNFARQAGFDASSGDIAAFLDADCIPPADWLERIGTFLSSPDVAAISGPYDLGFKGLYRWCETIYTRHIFAVLDRALFFVFRKKAGVIMGGNFAASRATINAIGGFPPFAFHGDDSAVAMLVSRKVGRVSFQPGLRVISSPRRFNREGHLKLTSVYAWHYMKNYFTIA